MVITAALAALPGTVTVAADTKGAKQKDPAKLVEDAIRAEYAGMASPKKEEQVKALRRILPAKMDIEVLFPKQAEKLWPLVEKANQRYLDHISDIVREVTKDGPITKIKLTNIRDEKGPAGSAYQPVLKMIPKNVPVFRYDIRYASGAGAGGDSYLLVNDRVILIPDFSYIPELIQELEKQKKTPR
jgi:hypothetical protein